MIVASLALTTFISNNPGVVSAILGALLAIIGSLIVAFWNLIAYRLRKLEAVDESLNTRLAAVEQELEKYMEHVGVGDKQMVSVNDGLNQLSKQLNQIAMENIKAHADIITGFAPRLSTIETKVAAIERNMPNGELKEMLAMLRALAAK